MRLAALAALGVLVAAAPARAFVLTEDALDGKSLELGGTVRNFNLLLHGGALDLVPGGSPAAVTLTNLRVKLDWRAHPSFRLVIHDELALTVGSSGLGDSQGPLALGQGRRAPLWLPLDWQLAGNANLRLSDRIDWLWARYSRGRFQLTLGRQPVTLGRGVIWTPMDLFAPFSPLQLDTEFKPGVDALRVDVRLGARVSLTLLGALGRYGAGSAFAVDAAGSAALARLDVALARWRLGAIGGYVRQDVVFGVDVFHDLGAGADVHAALTVTYVPEESRRRFGAAVFARALAGLSVEPRATLHATVEVYYNGSGATQPSDYAAGLGDERFQVGEVYNLGRWYGGVVLDWQPHTLVHLGAALLANLGDPSALVAPQLRYEVASNTLLIAGAFVPLGAAPELGADGGLVAHGEYGLYPYFYHVDLKLYF